MNARLRLAVIVASLLLAANSASGALILALNETFDTSTGSTAATLSTYPAFTFTDYGTGSTATVSGGVLGVFKLDDLPGAALITNESYDFSKPFQVKVDMTQSGAAGSASTPFAIGNRAFRFFPGFAGPPSGSLRVHAFNALTGLGAELAGATDMGFSGTGGPKQAFFHTFDITGTGNGVLMLTATDGETSNTFSYQFPANPLTSPHDETFLSGPVALIAWGGITGNSTSRFDNLQVFVTLTVPEPSTLLLLSAAIVMSTLTRRWRAS